MRRMSKSSIDSNDSIDSIDITEKKKSPHRIDTTT